MLALEPPTDAVDEPPDELAEGEGAAAGPKNSRLAKLKSFRPNLGSILTMVAATAMATATGGGLGFLLFTQVQEVVAAKIKGESKATQLAEKYASSLVVQALEPVVTNLAAPSSVWIRLELTMVFAAGSLVNPQQVAAELRQDVLAYARTMTLAQLESPSALQHLREDLNERASLRTDGKVREVIVQSMIVQ